MSFYIVYWTGQVIQNRKAWLAHIHYKIKNIDLKRERKRLKQI